MTHNVKQTEHGPEVCAEMTNRGKGVCAATARGLEVINRCRVRLDQKERELMQLLDEIIQCVPSDLSPEKNMEQDTKLTQLLDEIMDLDFMQP